MTDLVALARQAVETHPHADIEAALEFCETVCPDFCATSNDRLVKLGRSLRSLVELANDNAEFDLASSLDLQVQECQVLMSGNIRVPTVKFGKTLLDMPVVTLGCMRFQQEWGARITDINMVGSDCQDNLVAILKHAISMGIVHIETARGYGCSELQLGVALKQLFRTGFCQRSDLIIQTKVPANSDPQAFRSALETSFKNLQVDYVDLFALHGINFDEQLDWIWGRDGDNCWAVVEEYRKAGKVRHVGFSTHGATELILECIGRGCFDYVNLHYHYFGSYTASGGGGDGQGNLAAVKLAAEKNMGIFVISPFDKGGRLYAPSRRLRSLTLPEMEPMTFKSWWIWNHHRLQGDLPALHTYTVGAARPADLDQPAVAAHLHATQPDQVLDKLVAVRDRLEAVKIEKLGREWVETWWNGLPKAKSSAYLVEHNQVVWIYNSIVAFGMYEFGKARYNSFEKNGSKWEPNKSAEENIDKNIGRNAWGFVPGLPLNSNIDYTEDLKNVPRENFERVKEAEAFVYRFCRDRTQPEENGIKDRLVKKFRRNFSVSSQLFRVPNLTFEEGDNEKDDKPAIPKDWETAYDMRPWPDYPDQPSRS